jgi:flagellin-like protein
MHAYARQRGWAGLIGLLIVLAIVLVLGRTVLRQMGLTTPSATTASTPMSRQMAPEAANAQAASSQLQVTAPIERARGVEATVQQQVRDAAANVERSSQ